MSRYIVVTNSANTATESRNALTAFFEGKGWSVWHWFEDLWLLDNVPDDLQISVIRDEILSTFPAIRQFLIMSTEGLKNHAGSVPTQSIPWLNEHWQRR